MIIDCAFSCNFILFSLLSIIYGYCRFFAESLYTGGNVLLCSVYHNFLNLLSITGNLCVFQTFGIVNNAVMNNSVNKMFLCISNYSPRIAS